MPCLKKQSIRNRKYYSIDTDLRRSVITKTGADLGKVFENIVFRDLKKNFDLGSEEGAVAYTCPSHRTRGFPASGATKLPVILQITEVTKIMRFFGNLAFR